jgi:hypothetical protein
MSLYDSGNILVAERRSVVTLMPGETRVVFEPNIITGERVPVRAFMKVDGGTWDRRDATPSEIRIILGAVDEKSRTFSATLENMTAAPINNVVADALLYDAAGILVTASETRVAVLGPRERHEAVFTWSEAFPKPIITSDVVVRLDAIH